MQRDMGSGGYDIIGDIHGQHAKLEALLSHLGYAKRGGIWKHPDRQAIFMGDFIDRGPEPFEVVRTVRAMVEGGSALAIMGNHEYNAIRWTIPDPERPGDFLRRHNDATRAVHASFLEAVGGDGSRRHSECLAWFRTLPLWLTLGCARFVHACWDEKSVHIVREYTRDGCINDDAFYQKAARKGKRLIKAVGRLLTGVAVDLPDGARFIDKDGHARPDVRLRWWLPALAGRPWKEVAALSGKSLDTLPEKPFPGELYTPKPLDAPVFVGHYWLSPDAPKAPLAPFVACVDYSAGSTGPLVAYRWNGDCGPLCADAFVAAGENNPSLQKTPKGA